MQEKVTNLEDWTLWFGVGNELSKGKQVDYVVGKWDSEEATTLEARVKLTNEMIQGFATIGLQRTMSAYNNK